jgi:hypothetical protein
MLWQLLWLALGGLAVGSLGRLAVPGAEPLPWRHALAAGLAGALGGGLAISAVLGSQHPLAGLLAALLLAVLSVAGYSAYRRARDLPPS